jgi:RNA polymerase sigma-70 factor (ECF subfamily)
LRAISRFPEAGVADAPGTHGEVARALRTLSDAKRDVLLLADVEGFSAPEIAEMLKIPVGTVWTRLHHGRKELRALLEGPHEI